METVIAYFDETGDDGLINSSSQDFVLTSIYTKTANWQRNFNVMKNFRAIRAYNPIQSHYSFVAVNQPVKCLIEDILEKDSSESYFIQICDFVSYFVHLYFKCVVNGQTLPARVQNVIDTQFVSRVMATLKYYDRLNLKASKSNEYGLVIYPR